MFALDALRNSKRKLADLELVNEVKKYPCLYNEELCHNSPTNPTEEEAWEMVAQKLNRSANLCSSRWKTLLKNFEYHIESSPSDTPYYLSEAMQFITPFIKQELNLPSTTIAEVERQLELELQAISELDNEKINKSVIQIDSDSDGDEDIADSGDSYQLQPTTSQVLDKLKNSDITVKKPLKRPHDSNLDSTSELHVQCKRQNMSTLIEKHEANKMFLLSLLQDVDRMTESQVLEFKEKCMRLINDILVIKKEP